ncbi:dicarboxylate/amino acid:cation symporter [Sneathia sanguinegens]|uniref:Dicarboxylate/amino acid:cation symporter n=1 Tax=Sneathia sanguinegens TaxID=40543 RepID=A0ABT7HKK6_9FUSO|nr:dicarboxylate/amino acid:cation symporter [Sneathia sanguinegens]MDK9580712.1 dicarboxylate/amino acid:cation symporter [Sneathia sanguinegens]
MKKLKSSLVIRLIFAIFLGIILGNFLPLSFVRIFKTFTSFFGSFLAFFIPFMIIGFVVIGIARLSEGAGILLALTAGISYISTIIAGLFSYTVAFNFYPNLVSTDLVKSLQYTISNNSMLVSPYFTIPLSPALDVTTAIVFAFMVGITISYMRKEKIGETTFNIFNDFEMIVTRILNYFIIPLLPIHIFGIICELTYTGEVFSIIKLFITIYLCIFAMHYIYMLVMFSIAGTISKKNPFRLIKNQISGYLTAVGTQSSAATIPVNIQCGLKNGTSKEIVNFVVPLCATIHLSGSMITITSCVMGVLIMSGMNYSLTTILPFIAMLGIAMVAAPGAPGGAIMSALPFLYMINIDSNGPLGALLIALYLTQDSFGTAINVSGDNAIAIYVDEFYKKFIKNSH